MKKFFKTFLPKLIPLVERGICIAAFYFPLVETLVFFGPKIYVYSSLSFRTFYFNSFLKMAKFYNNYDLLMFSFMAWLFIWCIHRSCPLTRFARFNIVQAILLSVIFACLGTVYHYSPIVLRESLLGVFFAHSAFMGCFLLIAYCSLLIAYGRIPKIPIVSEGARLNMQHFG